MPPSHGDTPQQPEKDKETEKNKIVQAESANNHKSPTTETKKAYKPESATPIPPYRSLKWLGQGNKSKQLIATYKPSQW
jgi:hypothetical protein